MKGIATYKDGKYIDNDINEAWLLYCEETAGCFDVRDCWNQLPVSVRLLYLNRIERNRRLLGEIKQCFRKSEVSEKMKAKES
jgi:hypothetical protein